MSQSKIGYGITGFLPFNPICSAGPLMIIQIILGWGNNKNNFFIRSITNWPWDWKNFVVGLFCSSRKKIFFLYVIKNLRGSVMHDKQFSSWGGWKESHQRERMTIDSWEIYNFQLFSSIESTFYSRRAILLLYIMERTPALWWKYWLRQAGRRAGGNALFQLERKSNNKRLNYSASFNFASGLLNYTLSYTLVHILYVRTRTLRVGAFKSEINVDIY